MRASGTDPRRVVEARLVGLPHEFFLVSLPCPGRFYQRTHLPPNTALVELLRILQRQ
mgnify:CR=1 FL=1